MGEFDSGIPLQAPQRTECMSASATLFWRVFVPIFGTVFLLGFALAAMLISGENLYLPFPTLWFRLGAVGLLIGWLLLVKNTIWRLKRVDVNETHFFVTNYWQTIRYPWSDISHISESFRMGKKLNHLHLKASGRFGQVISFLPASQFQDFLVGLRAKYPEL